MSSQRIGDKILMLSLETYRDSAGIRLNSENEKQTRVNFHRGRIDELSRGTSAFLLSTTDFPSENSQGCSTILKLLDSKSERRGGKLSEEPRCFEMCIFRCAAVGGHERANKNEKIFFEIRSRPEND